MWWECILRAAGLSFLMSQRAGQSQGLAAASHASQPVGEVGAEAFRCRVPAGGVGEILTLLLDAPAVVGRGEYLILVIEVVAAHPQPGQSLPLHHGWALLYACLPTCLLAAAGRCSKIKILTATRSISLCSFIYR